eukprot:m.97207 g.97207  ORF g.97207 m.97207 type:complete len:157 (+) comp20510_c0_seq4:925-1395(+)
MFVNHNPSGYQYPGNFTTDLKRLLRPDVLCITVSQNDEGIAGGKHDVLPMSDVPNLLVLSAGGYGHFPVPLLKQPVSPCRSSTPFSRKYDFVFAGTVGNAPHKMRESVAASIHAYAAQRHKAVHVGRSKSWQTLIIVRHQIQPLPSRVWQNIVSIG